SHRSLLAVALGLALLAAPSALQAQDHSAIIEYRQSIMNAFRTHMGGVGAAMANTVPMDHAGNHAVAFHEMALSLANVWPQGSTSTDSRALAGIWENRNDFMNKVTAIQAATSELVDATETGDAEAVGAALQAVQGTCRGCHTDYRGPAN
ncbi:MAG: cytochrome c, partial [Gemmatimonadetes bacterium]|nr:cytochrome c [Gemmatimonadota bacterium]